MIESTEAITGFVNRTPTLNNRLSSIVRTLQFRGAKASLAHYSQRAVQILKRQSPPETAPDPVAAEGRFAQGDFGAPLTELAIESPNARWGLPYVPTHREFFATAMGSLPIAFDEYDFVDLGAGKGFALLLAAGYHFRSVPGVEYSKVFAETCQGRAGIFHLPVQPAPVAPVQRALEVWNQRNEASAVKLGDYFADTVVMSDESCLLFA